MEKGRRLRDIDGGDREREGGEEERRQSMMAGLAMGERARAANGEGPGQRNSDSDARVAGSPRLTRCTLAAGTT